MNTSAFVVIFEGRTGSSELMARMNKNPKIEALPEILHPLCGDRGTRIDWDGIEVLMRRIANGERVDTYAESYSKKNEACESLPIRGFKTRLNSEEDRWWYQAHGVEANFYSIPADRFLTIASEYGYFLIHLYRKDLLRQSISWLRAAELSRRRNEWNVMAGDHPLEAIALDPEDVVKTIEWLSASTIHHENAYNAYTGRKISVTYENLFGDNQPSFFSDLLNFLGADAHTVSEHYRKATPEDLTEAVSNYSEIERLLAVRLPDVVRS
jgi:LPS sulfotransferase NodH